MVWKHIDGYVAKTQGEEGTSRYRVMVSVGKVPGTKGQATCAEGSDRL